MGKMGFVVGFGVGYVLGSKAGHQRYEELVRVARQVRDHPAVQTTAGLVGGQASDLLARARDHAGHALHVGHVLHVGHPRSSNGAAANGTAS